MNLTPNNAIPVRVNWEDIQFGDNWGYDDEAILPVESSTIGYLLHNDDNYLVIGASYDWQKERWGTVHSMSKRPPQLQIFPIGPMRDADDTLLNIMGIGGRTHDDDTEADDE